MTEDVDLLRLYAETGSEAAFAELVQRRINLVYSVAFRCTRDRQRAEDVTQAVFVAAARKAHSLCQRPVIVGWLYRSAQLAARDAIRAEARRSVREQEAYTMEQISRDSAEPDWNEARPVLDEVLSGLNDADRDAILLRFVEGRSFSEIGGMIRVTENGARMRVDRALEKLRRALARRGVTSSAAAIVAGVGAPGALLAAPAGLAAHVTAAAVTGAAAASAGTGLAAVLMSTSKIHLAVAAVAVAAGTAGFVQQMSVAADLRREVSTLRAANAELARERTDIPMLRKQAEEATKLRAGEADLAGLQADIAALRERSKRANGVATVLYKAERRPTYTGPYFEEAQVDQKATPTNRPSPKYPRDFAKAEIEGEAILDIIIDEKGAARNVTVVSSSRPEFGEAAAAAVSEWEYKPAQRNGQVVAVHVREPIRFTIDRQGSMQKKPAPFVPWF